jgi:hypothetical protein
MTQQINIAQENITQIEIQRPTRHINITSKEQTGGRLTPYEATPAPSELPAVRQAARKDESTGHRGTPTRWKSMQAPDQNHTIKSAIPNKKTHRGERSPKEIFAYQEAAAQRR